MRKEEYQKRLSGISKNVMTALESYGLLDENQMDTVKKLLLTSIDASFREDLVKEYRYYNGTSENNWGNRRRVSDENPGAFRRFE